MDLPFAAMREYSGNGARERGRGRPPTRWPVGGADWRETMFGLSWIPAGSNTATDLAEPERSELRETLERMLRALDSAPPPARGNRCRRIGLKSGTHSETPGCEALRFRRLLGLAWGSPLTR